MKSIGPTTGRTPLKRNHLHPFVLSLCMVTLFLVFSLSTAQAQISRPLGAGAQAAGFGDAVRASALGHNALYFNPAGMAQSPSYRITTQFSFANDLESYVPSVSLVDSATNRFLAAGVGYAFGSSKPTGGVSGDRENHEIRGALATGFTGENVGVYVGASMLWSGLSIDDSDLESFWTMDAGAIVSFQNIVRIGVVGHNLIPNDAPAVLPLQLGMGASAMFSGFIIEFDSVLDFDTHDSMKPMYQVGTQYTVMGMVPLRLGFQYDDIHLVPDGNDFVPGKRITAGIGYWSPSFMVDVGYQQDVVHTSDFGVGIELSFFVP